MVSAITSNFLITIVFAFLVYSLASITALGMPVKGQVGRMATLALALIPFTALAYYISKSYEGEVTSKYELAMNFLNKNFQIFLIIVSILFISHNVAVLFLQKWCQRMSKKPCSVMAMMAREICQNAGGPGFGGCAQAEAVNYAKHATSDLKFSAELVGDSFSGLGDAINDARYEFNQIRTGIDDAFTAMYQGIIGSMLPELSAALHVKAMMGQMQAVLATVAYLLLAGLMGVKAFIGGFLQVSDTTVEILGATLAVMLAVMFFSPWLAVPAGIIAGILAIVAEPLIVISRMARGLGIQW